jgi:hypothetical protein
VPLPPNEEKKLAEIQAENAAANEEKVEIKQEEKPFLTLNEVWFLFFL